MTKQKTKIQKVKTELHDKTEDKDKKKMKNLLVSLFRERRNAFGGFIKTGTAKSMREKN